MANRVAAAAAIPRDICGNLRRTRRKSANICSKLLETFFEHVFKDRYPIGESLSQVIVWQLGEFREHRATKHIQSISKNCPDHWADTAHEALAKIREDP